MRKRIQAVFTLMSQLKKKQFSGMDSEDGSAMVIALLIMMLLMGFVALAVTRTNSETMASANDAMESRTFDAANASLEVMTRNFDKIFDVKLNPDPADLTHIESQVPPGFPDYTFAPINGSGGQRVLSTGPAKAVIMKGGAFQGLNALQDEWKLDTTATNTATGVQVALSRRFLNNRIPIFQFGIFYDDDMEFHPGPVFNFGGRVHSNGNIFLAAGTGLTFSSKVTAHNNIFTDVGKNGKPYSTWGDNVFVKNGSGVPTRVFNYMGSVLANTVNGAPVSNYPAPLPPAPTAYKNANWTSGLNYSGKFDGNLLANQQELKLPIKINAQITAPGSTVDLVQLIRRGKNINVAAGTNDVFNDGTGTVAAPNLSAVTATKKDDAVTASERYYNKTGIRVSLADSKNKLPGCATSTAAAVVTACGVRLDWDPAGTGGGAAPAALGYQPRTMSDGYTATELTGERFYTPGKAMWIKIETVQYNATTQNYDTQDITADILSLGITERAPDLGNNNFRITQGAYNTGNTDSRSIIKLQHFLMSGPWTAANTGVIQNTALLGPPASYMSGNAGFWTPNVTYNYIEPATVAAGNNCSDTTKNAAKINGATLYPNGLTVPAGWVATNSTQDRLHWRNAVVGGLATTECVVAFPINMFDTREGLFNETSTVFNRDGAYKVGANYNVPWNGVMSMVDIDVANLRNFLNGNFDGGANPALPYAAGVAGTVFNQASGRALKSTDIPSANGWVLYVSDRRGDRDFDGEYDMEDIFGNNDGNLQLGEDINGNATLQADYTCTGGAQEAVKYTSSGIFANSTCTGNGWGSYVSPDVAASFEHPFYRRGIRLINGSDLPGAYDTVTPNNTKGFTVASENGVYVLGNYNAVGDVTAVGSPSQPTDYSPQGARDVPASIAADAVTVLSNSWSDNNSFTNPFDSSLRQTNAVTSTRFAMLSGDSITTVDATPNQGGNDTRMNGGVHNFIRFLEQWNVRLNYCGSLINLYNAHNNNGTYKNGSGTVYAPPTRNWVFDATFLDINRIPPGTPFFQQIQITGFQRINN